MNKIKVAICKECNKPITITNHYFSKNFRDHLCKDIEARRGEEHEQR